MVLQGKKLAVAVGLSQAVAKFSSRYSCHSAWSIISYIHVILPISVIMDGK